MKYFVAYIEIDAYDNQRQYGFEEFFTVEQAEDFVISLKGKFQWKIIQGDLIQSGEG